MERQSPAYRVLADTLRTAILENEFSHGKRLPTEAELSAEHGVSRQTVRRAYQDLVADGIVHRVAGRGTFPAPRRQYLRSFGSVDELLALSIDTELEIVQPLHNYQDPDKATLLGLQFDEVSEVQFIRSHQGAAFCFTCVTLPPRVGTLLAEVPFLQEVGARSQTTIIAVLESAINKPIVGAKQSVTAIPTPAEMAPLLACEIGSPMLYIERLYFDLDDRPVEFATNFFNPERYSYRLQLHRAPT